MPIVTEVPRSPGWWLQRLFNQITDRRRRRRLQLLKDYHQGNAPLPVGAENAREAFEAFQRKARSNFAELIVSAVSERMTPVGFRTSLDDDATGDAEVGRLWRRAGLDVTAADVHDMMLALGEAYVIVGAVDEDTGAPAVTCEDPRFLIAEAAADNPRKLLAALKVLHDSAAAEDRAYLYLPGEVHVAVRRASRMDLPGVERIADPNVAALQLAFDFRNWEWDPQRSGRLPHQRLPVVMFRNRYGLGEFESHTDLLDRVNHQVLQRMVIATMQAFRQRAIKGAPLVYPDEHPLAGQPINYDEIFTADPAALWLLPATAEMWESGQVDLTPILSAVKDDLEQLAAVTRTPMHMLSPGGVNQSAEGASLSREGLVFKCEDRISRTSHPWTQVISLALLHTGQPDRADLAGLETIWAPVDRPSLTELAQAASQLAPVLPKRTLLIRVLRMSPAEADRTMTEIADDQILAAQLQATLLGAAQGQTPAAAAAGPAAGQGTVAEPAVTGQAPPPATGGVGSVS